MVVSKGEEVLCADLKVTGGDLVGKFCGKTIVLKESSDDVD